MTTAIGIAGKVRPRMMAGRRTRSVCRPCATIIQTTIPSTTTATADPSQRYCRRSSPVERRDRATMPSRATTWHARSIGNRRATPGVSSSSLARRGSANGLGTDADRLSREVDGDRRSEGDQPSARTMVAISTYETARQPALGERPRGEREQDPQEPDEEEHPARRLPPGGELPDRVRLARQQLVQRRRRRGRPERERQADQQQQPRERLAGPSQRQEQARQRVDRGDDDATRVREPDGPPDHQQRDRRPRAGS